MAPSRLRDIGVTTQLHVGDVAGCTYPLEDAALASPRLQRPVAAQPTLENRTAAAVRAALPDTRNLT